MTRDNEHTQAPETIFDAFARIYKRDWNDPEAADQRDQFERGWSAGQDALFAGQAPYAWAVHLPAEDDVHLYFDRNDAGLIDDLTNNDDAEVTPLYAAPVAAQAQPSDQEIENLAMASGILKSQEHWGVRYYTNKGSDLFRFSRALLARYGVPDHFRDATKMIADAAECLDTITSNLDDQHPLRQQALNEAKGHVANLYGIASGAAQARPEGVMVKPQQPSRYPHITLPYTLAEIEARMATHDYSAELLLQHAMLLLQAQQPVSGADGLPGASS